MAMGEPFSFFSRNFKRQPRDHRRRKKPVTIRWQTLYVRIYIYKPNKKILDRNIQGDS